MDLSDEGVGCEKVMKEVNGIYSAIAIKFLVISFFPCFKVVVGAVRALISSMCAYKSNGAILHVQIHMPKQLFQNMLGPPKMLSLSPDKLQLTEAN